MNWKRRIWMSLVLAVVLAVLPISSSYAAGRTVQLKDEEGIDPQYVNTINITADLVIKGNNAHAYASAVAKKVCRVTVTMRLQRKEDGVWKTKVSWVGSSTSGSKTMGEDFTLTQRGTYRTYAIFDVAGENLTYISSSQVY